ncbi:MAG: OmcA/MtrC family decaheme c-type cytochrome [Acidobacteriota bacterium]
MRFGTTVRVAPLFTLLAGSALWINASAPKTDPNLINFVRPGLVVKITGAAVATDGTLRVRFTLADPKGSPLDREGVTSPGPVSVSFIAAYIPTGQSQYTSYTTRVQTSPITRVSATQAGADSGGSFEVISEGLYQYTFGTRLPAGFDRTATHSIGAYSSRNLSEFDMGIQRDDDVYHFVPDGSKVTVVRDVTRSETCNRCHHQLAFHGGSRRSVELCILCHQPQTTDPDTGNTVDMPVMIHRIHMGRNLPSVVAGKPYQIIGNQQVVHDYSKIRFPPDARSCAACHQPGAAQADNYLKPNRAACGACHDDLDFRTGKGHLDLPQVSDNQCANCHIKRGELEFDASILGAHTIPRLSPSLPGVVFEILSVEDGVAGKRPTVVFSLKEKSGKPIAPLSMNRLNLILAGPNTDYASYISEAVLNADGTADGRYWWTFQDPIPAGAKGSYSIEIEGRRELKLLEGTTQERTVRDSGANKVFAFSVDGSRPEPRRAVVSIDKCNACHGSLSFHGDNRNRIEACVVCHNPLKTGGPNGSLSIAFPVMIHRIHTGQDLTIPYAFSANFNFNEIGYPGDRRNCAACHVNGSEQLPLKGSGRLNVVDPSGYLNPAAPISAACTGCHTSKAVAAHALSSTNALGEGCAACHGAGAEFSVSSVHAWQ